MSARATRLCAAACAAAVACAPELDVAASRVTAPRVIAVRADPPEARPGSAVRLTAVVASPTGDVADPGVSWRACEVPRSATDSATVSSRCLGDAGALEALGNGASVTVTIPADACVRVGPQVPPVGQDMERLRAPDPDVTGAWQLPVRLDLRVGDAAETLFARYRIRCQPPDVPGATAQAYATRYRENVNPRIAAVLDVARGAALPLRRSGSAEGGSDAVSVVSEGAQLAVQWEADAAERYVAVDPATRGLVERAESLEVAWFTDGGRFEADRTGPDASGRRAVNRLRLDAGRATATVWVALRDDRGGVDFAVIMVRRER